MNLFHASDASFMPMVVDSIEHCCLNEFAPLEEFS
jgi:hypothetical protein